MARYLRRNRLSEALDGLGVRLLLLAAAVGWFTWLWGLGMPALLAGAALGLLLMMTRTAWRRRNVARRELALRSRLGAELFLEELLYAEAQEAHARTAELPKTRDPLTIKEVTQEGAICCQGDETILLQCLRMPPEGEISVGDLRHAQRICRRLPTDRAVLCVMGRVSPKTAARAEDMAIPVRIIRREMLLALAGRVAPATDEQLVALGQRKHGRAGKGGIARLVFRRDKAKRYVGYGMTMLLLYVLTGARLYAVPGMVCLVMGVVSGCDHCSDAVL